MSEDAQDADGVDRAARRDEATALDNTEGHPIILHNVGGKEPDGKPTRLGKWTFGTKMVKDVVLDHVDGRVLNACAGKTRLEKRGCEFFRNDIDEDRDADIHVDVREIHQHLEAETFDAAILDPPFDPGRAEKLYEGWHGQEYSNARDAVAELVCPGGVVVELGWNSWSLSDKDGWEPVEHHIYRQSSFKADVHLTVDRKVNQKRLVTDGGRVQDGDDIESCPNCETDLLVAGAQGPYYRWTCHGCDERWGENPTEPIAYDAVDRWYESRSPDGTRLHTDPSCPSTDAIMTHSPSEARENRHGRCLTCGHKVVR